MTRCRSRLRQSRPTLRSGSFCVPSSDDACVLPFLIPSNLFVVTALRQLSEIVTTELRDKEFARTCTALSDEIENAILRFGIVNHGSHGKMYAYEVDGFGNALCMDDANIPSLLSLTYLGCVPEDDPVYARTRRFILSDDNPISSGAPQGRE